MQWVPNNAQFETITILILSWTIISQLATISICDCSIYHPKWENNTSLVGLALNALIFWCYYGFVHSACEGQVQRLPSWQILAGTVKPVLILTPTYVHRLLHHACPLGKPLHAKTSSNPKLLEDKTSWLMHANHYGWTCIKRPNQLLKNPHRCRSQLEPAKNCQ